MKRITRNYIYPLCCALALSAASFVHAQELQFARQDGPYYVGEPVLVQVTASGFDAADEISCSFDGTLSDGVSISEPQVGTTTRHLTQFINGRPTRSRSIEYKFNFVVNASKEGEFPIGPFKVIRNGESHIVRGTRFEFGTLEPDPNMEIGFSLERDTIYVGEKIPLTIRWAFGGSIDEVQVPFSNLQIRSPLFDQFSFSDPPRRSRTSLTLATAKGGVEIDATVTREQKNNQEFIVVTSQRTMIADTPGTFDTIAISCRTKKVTRWGRDIFGSPRAAATAPALSAGPPLNFTVKPIPTNGRPISYAGAVGRGFSIDVAANRSVVRVGDPISLTINITGDGNLESISLPELVTQMGLSADDFQVPDEQLSGTIDGNMKQFKVNVRVKDQQIQQIPGLAFSWFDPVEERFVEVDSKPIALQVMDTKIVSSNDVISTPKSNSANAADESSTQDSPATLSFAGANLAIEKDLERLLAQTDRHTLKRYASPAIYGLAIVLGLFVFVRGRRSDDTINKGKAKNRIAQIRRSIKNAETQPGKEAFASIAASLREFIRERNPENREQFEQLIAECDNTIYSQSESVDKSVIQRIVKLSLVAIDRETKHP